jgi:hypothetical protein
MEFQESKEYKTIFKFSDAFGHKLNSREGITVEFKESFNWASKDEYAKILASFVNNRGGNIAFGIKDKPRELIGLQSTNFESMDEAIMTQYLNSIFSPEMEFEKFVFNERKRKVGILHVNSSKYKPLISIKNDGCVKEGEIYYRYNARSDKIKFPELKNLINQIQENERKNWMSLFQKISNIGPENAAILDIVGGKIEGQKGSIFIDRKLIPKLKFVQEGKFHEKGSPTLKLIGDVKPVSIIKDKKNPMIKGKLRITDDPKAQEIRITDDQLFEEFPLDYNALRERFYKRYRGFKANLEFHRIRKQLVEKGTYSITRHLNPKNIKSAKQIFYSPKIYKEFDKHYNKKGDS